MTSYAVGVSKPERHRPLLDFVLVIDQIDTGCLPGGTASMGMARTCGRL